MNPESNKNTADLKRPKNSFGNSFSSAIFYLSILFFIIGFNFSDVMVGNWYQQFLPYLGSKQINDIIFLDSLTGFAIASRNVNQDTSSILRTTNGGDNWQIIFTQSSRRFSKIKFANNSTGFISGGNGSGTPYLYKTTDGGNSWSTVPGATLGNAFWGDMSVINVDTIWLTDDNSLNGGVFFTSNGGVNWIQQLNIGSSNPNRLYMVNSRIGFIAEDFNYLRKTTNSGVNWTVVPGADGFLDMHFVDTLTGWKSYGLMKKTTDGGNSWFTQTLPSGGQLLSSGMGKFSVLNRDTIWGVGGQIQAGVSTIRGIIFRTVDGGASWLFQTPDTSYGNFNYYHIQFADRNHGWAYTTVKGIHTTTGGDPIWITAIEQISSEVPKEFKLFQNYPNPFNPNTKIKFQLLKQGNAEIVIYDVTGKRIQKLLNEKLSAGEYEMDFNASGLSSGTYFYKLIINSGKEVFTETKKMLMVK